MAVGTAEVALGRAEAALGGLGLRQQRSSRSGVVWDLSSSLDLDWAVAGCACPVSWMFGPEKDCCRVVLTVGSRHEFCCDGHR